MAYGVVSSGGGHCPVGRHRAQGEKHLERSSGPLNPSGFHPGLQTGMLVHTSIQTSAGGRMAFGAQHPQQPSPPVAASFGSVHTGFSGRQRPVTLHPSDVSAVTERPRDKTMVQRRTWSFIEVCDSGQFVSVDEETERVLTEQRSICGSLLSGILCSSTLYTALPYRLVVCF